MKAGKGGLNVRRDWKADRLRPSSSLLTFILQWELLLNISSQISRKTGDSCLHAQLDTGQFRSCGTFLLASRMKLYQVLSFSSIHTLFAQETQSNEGKPAGGHPCIGNVRTFRSLIRSVNGPGSLGSQNTAHCASVLAPIAVYP